MRPCALPYALYLPRIIRISSDPWNIHACFISSWQNGFEEVSLQHSDTIANSRVEYIQADFIQRANWLSCRQNGAGQRNVGLLDDPAARLPLLHSNALDASDAVIQKEPLHDHYPHRPGYLGLVSDIAVPVGVMSLGVVVSCAALWVSIAHLLEQQ